MSEDQTASIQSQCSAEKTPGGELNARLVPLGDKIRTDEFAICVSEKRDNLLVSGSPNLCDQIPMELQIVWSQRSATHFLFQSFNQKAATDEKCINQTMILPQQTPEVVFRGIDYTSD